MKITVLMGGISPKSNALKGKFSNMVGLADRALLRARGKQKIT